MIEIVGKDSLSSIMYTLIQICLNSSIRSQDMTIWGAVAAICTKTKKICPFGEIGPKSRPEDQDTSRKLP